MKLHRIFPNFVDNLTLCYKNGINAVSTKRSIIICAMPTGHLKTIHIILRSVYYFTTLLFLHVPIFIAVLA